MNRTRLGSFKEAAKVLSELSGFPWSRQRVNQYWIRQQKGDINGFPDMRCYLINGHEHFFFDMVDIADWYGYVEAANHFTMLTGTLWTPSKIYRMHQEKSGFPKRIWVTAEADDIDIRVAFDLAELKSYWEHGGLDG